MSKNISAAKLAHGVIAPLTVISLITAILFAWSWREWVDVLVDSGYSLYTFWQLAEGKTLYSDIAYYHGPLSPYLCAAVFKFFGVSISVLAYVNAVFVVLFSFLMYRIFLYACNVLTAILITLSFLFVFAFGQYTYTANYNYIFPYKHEVLHGLFFCLSIIYAFLLAQKNQKNQTGYFAFMGICLGGALLTSYEMAFAAVAISAVAIYYFRRGLFPLLAGAFLFPALMLGFLLSKFSFFEATQHTFTAILMPLKKNAISHNPFFLHILGLDDPWGSARWIIFSILTICSIVALLQYMNLRLREHSEKQRKEYSYFVAAAFVLAALFVPQLAYIWIWDYTRAFPFFGVLFLLLATRFTNPARGKVLVLWGVLSLALLPKILFRVHIEHYGFILAMPVMLSFLALLCFLLPDYLENRRAWPADFIRYAAVGFAVGIGILYLQQTNHLFQQKVFAIGEGGDTIHTWNPGVLPEGMPMAAALEWLKTNSSPKTTLLTVPEGVMLNYLSRRVRPALYSMNVVEYLTHGEEKILEEWKKNPPDLIALVGQDPTEFGMPPFGSTLQYGKKTMGWILTNYAEAVRFGATPFQRPDLFGIQILRRK